MVFSPLCVNLSPQEQKFFTALVDFYLKSRNVEKAKRMAEAVLREKPEHVGAKELLRYLGKQ